MCKDIRTRGTNSSLVVIKNDAASSAENAGSANIMAENAGSTNVTAESAGSTNVTVESELSTAENANVENAKITEPTTSLACASTACQ